jgi:hypothetical protein
VTPRITLLASPHICLYQNPRDNRQDTHQDSPQEDLTPNQQGSPQGSPQDSPRVTPHLTPALALQGIHTNPHFSFPEVHGSPPLSPVKESQVSLLRGDLLLNLAANLPCDQGSLQIPPSLVPQENRRVGHLPSQQMQLHLPPLHRPWV